jgi:hypothetical protein
LNQATTLSLKDGDHCVDNSGSLGDNAGGVTVKGGEMVVVWQSAWYHVMKALGRKEDMQMTAGVEGIQFQNTFLKQGSA